MLLIKPEFSRLSRVVVLHVFNLFHNDLLQHFTAVGSLKINLCTM